MFGLFFTLIISSVLFLIFYLPIESVIIKGILLFLVIPILWVLRNYILEKFKEEKFLKYSIGILSILFIITIPYIFYINQRIDTISASIPIKYKNDFENAQKASDMAFSSVAQLPKLFITDLILLLLIVVLLLQLTKSTRIIQTNK